MIALNPIKKDELSHTEPKLWNRRRQIETPTVFNNVEEIPDSIEKFSVLFLRPQKLLYGFEQWRALLLCKNPYWPGTLGVIYWVAWISEFVK